MKKREKRVQKALEIALKHVEVVIEYKTGPDFVEVIGEIGGDVCTYRIYDDGSIYER